MLNFQEKLELISSFPQLTRKDVSMGRVNFAYEDSAFDKKNVVYHLHPNGNGFVYAARIPGVATDDKGFVSIRELEAEPLRQLITQAIQSLTGDQAETDHPEALIPATNDTVQHWKNQEGHKLTLTYDEDNQLWYLYAGANLDMAFESLEEAKEYLEEEGFSLHS